MPVCPGCCRSVRAVDLKVVPGAINCLLCPACAGAEENISNENPIFTLSITQIPTKEGDDPDYRISARVHHGGLSLEFDRTVSEIRRFFTERRERMEKRQIQQGRLKSLPRSNKE